MLSVVMTFKTSVSAVRGVVIHEGTDLCCWKNIHIKRTLVFAYCTSYFDDNHFQICLPKRKKNHYIYVYTVTIPIIFLINNSFLVFFFFPGEKAY